MLDSIEREINGLGDGDSNKNLATEEARVTEDDGEIPETSQSVVEEDDSLMQLINEKAAIVDQGEALEDFAQENNINRGKFINQQLKPFPNAIELSDFEI